MFAFTFDVGNSTDLYFLQLWIVHTYNTYVYIVFGRAEEPIFFASGKFHYGLIITEYSSTIFNAKKIELFLDLTKIGLKKVEVKEKS